MPREAVILDTLEVSLTKRVSTFQIDPETVDISERKSFRCFGYSVVGKLHGLAVTIDENAVVTIRKPWFSRDCTANLWLYAIILGFGEPRDDSPFNRRRHAWRTHRQRQQNDKFINSAYDRHE